MELLKDKREDGLSMSILTWKMETVKKFGLRGYLWNVTEPDYIVI